MKYILLLSLAFSTLFANQNNFIIKHDGLIDERAQQKINEIGLEAKNRLNANIYVYVIENNGINPKEKKEAVVKKFREFEQNVINSLPAKGSYAVLVLSVDQMYINILTSEDVAKHIDKKDILDGYVIPLLASKDKNTLFAKTSAATLNGYAQMADVLADSQKIKLESSIGSEGKTASTIWKMFMYSIVLFGIVAYAIIVMRQRRG